MVWGVYSEWNDFFVWCTVVCFMFPQNNIIAILAKKYTGLPRSMLNADQNHGIDPKCLSMLIIADQCWSIPLNADQCRIKDLLQLLQQVLPWIYVRNSCLNWHLGSFVDLALIGIDRHWCLGHWSRESWI